METLKTENSKIVEKRIGENIPRQAPRVSVIIPAYNVAEFIAETLKSVLSQTFTSYETILVNDGSPDTEKLEEALEPYFADIVYIKQKNSGAAAARNAAIRVARGELLAFLDGDDIWFPKYLALQTEALVKKKCDLIYADAFLFGNVSDKTETFMQKSPSCGETTAKSLIDGSCNLITSGTVVRRQRVLKCGLFDENLPKLAPEDFDLWFRLAKSGARLDYQRKVLLKYRVRPNSLSGSNVQRAERDLIALDIIERKHYFSDSEKIALAKRRKLVKAEIELEKGKLALSQENFEGARQHFRRANEHYQKIKLEAVMWLLAVNPKLVLKLFKKMRATEFLFTVPNGSTKNLVAERLENRRNQNQNRKYKNQQRKTSVKLQMKNNERSTAK